MTGSMTVTLDKVTQLVDRTHFTYNDQYGAGVQLSALVGSNKLHVDLSQPGQDPFDPAKIRVTDASGEVLSADKYTVSYTDEYGNPATLEDLSTSGDWKVIVKIDAKANKYEIGSYPQVMELHVTSGKVDVDTDAVFTYDGESVDDPLTLTFDESNHLDKLGAIVKFGGQDPRRGARTTSSPPISTATTATRSRPTRSRTPQLPARHHERQVRPVRRHDALH